MRSTIALPFLVRLAFFWNKVGPRGRGYVPRQIGKLYGPETDYTIETSHGAKLRIDMSNLEVYAPIYNAQGQWEPHVVSACARMLRSHEVFFDVGANAGMVTLETRAIVGSTVSIYAFEPQPSLAESLRRSIAMNDFSNINVLESLVSNSDGLGDLYLTSHAIHASMIPREAAFEKISRPVCKIDTLVGSGQCPVPHVVKIDTEGAEMKVLEGMAQTIKSGCPSLVFEADDNMERFGYAASDILDLLRSFQDYRCYSILPNGLLKPWGPKVASDILAVGPAHRDRIVEGWLS